MSDRDRELSRAIDALTELIEHLRMSGLPPTSITIKLAQHALDHCLLATSMSDKEHDDGR
jgi:hypothetical protein